MKFRAHVVDSQGRPRCEVLRADSEEEAREILLGEALHPKRIEEAGEEEKVTFVSRRRVEARLEERRTASALEGDERIVSLGPATRTVLTRDLIRTPGTVAFSGGTLAFEPDEGGDSGPLRLTAEDVETARLQGFPMRRLSVFLLSGGLLEFSAGVLTARPVFKAAAAAFGSKR